MIQNQFNCNLKTLRNDHDGEYTSHEFTNYLLHYGISHQFSCPYTPEQNGIAERKNRHIFETTRTLLHHASLPFQFWLEAASTAAYLINRLPTKTLQMQSPYQKLYHKSPSFLYLKTFGCLCYPWTAYSRNHKLEPKSSPCIFLGYSSDNKGFRCFDTNNSKLLISRHVRFHEYTFPMSNTSPTTPPPQISTVHNPISPLILPTFYPPPTNSPPPPTQPPHPNHHFPLPATPTPISNTNVAAHNPSIYPPPPYLPSFPYPRPHPPLSTLPELHPDNAFFKGHHACFE